MASARTATRRRSRTCRAESELSGSPCTSGMQGTKNESVAGRRCGAGVPMPAMTGCRRKRRGGEETGLAISGGSGRFSGLKGAVLERTLRRNLRCSREPPDEMERFSREPRRKFIRDFKWLFAVLWRVHSVQHPQGPHWPRNVQKGQDKGRHGTSCISDAWGVRTEPRRRSEGHLPPAFWIGESTSATRERGSLRGD